MGEDSTFEIGADLSLDEPTDGRALPPRPSQKGLELFANDLVQKRLLGFMAFVLVGGGKSTGIMGWSAALRALNTRTQATCRGKCEARLSAKPIDRAVGADAEPLRSHAQGDHRDSSLLVGS